MLIPMKLLITSLYAETQNECLSLPKAFFDIISFNALIAAMLFSEQDGLPEESEFELGGQKAWLRDGVGRLEDGTIACSAANLWDCMVNVIRWGIPEEDAIRAATWNPACAISAQEEVGSIREGKIADFIICQPDYSGKRVFLAGQELGANG